MPKETKARMVDGAATLLAKHGLQGTSFAEVLELTGAPRGSIYYHFPEGKDQLIGAALDLAGSRALGALQQHAGEGAVEITELFLGMWRRLLEYAKFSAGCAVLAVTVATDSPALLDQAAGVFRQWRNALADALAAGGLAPHDAKGFAATLLAASEGAVVLSRAERSLEPFDLVAGQLLAQVRALQGAAGAAAG